MKIKSVEHIASNYEEELARRINLLCKEKNVINISVTCDINRFYHAFISIGED